MGSLAPVRALVHGLADPLQAEEAGRLGVHGVVVHVGDGELPRVSRGRAAEIAAALPPLVLRLALLDPGQELPPGFAGAVTNSVQARPPGAGVRIVRLAHDRADPDQVPADAEAAWVRPRRDRTSAATAFDWERLARLSLAVPLLLEVPDGADGVEPAVRLGRPHGLVLADAVRFRPGILDLDALERALAVVARLNKLALAG